jgi:ribA/ribD-fused uncharacterized protein
MKITDKYVFFWNGIYSQWFMRDIIVDDVKYNCCEQYMMACKAQLFDDVESYKMIMYADNPKDQKALGRRVKGFSSIIWDQECKQIVFESNFAKFTQHPDLKTQLLDTGNRILVEASPYDTIWGIGMSETDHGVEDPKNWKGTNWLGIEITKVKESIMNELKIESVIQ